VNQEHPIPQTFTRQHLQHRNRLQSPPETIPILTHPFSLEQVTCLEDSKGNWRWTATAYCNSQGSGYICDVTDGVNGIHHCTYWPWTVPPGSGGKRARALPAPPSGSDLSMNVWDAAEEGDESDENEDEDENVLQVRAADYHGNLIGAKCKKLYEWACDKYDAFIVSSIRIRTAIVARAWFF
jgi:hypothetical protein